MWNEQEMNGELKDSMDPAEGATAVLDVDCGAEEPAAAWEDSADAAGEEPGDADVHEGRPRRRAVVSAAVGGVLLVTLGVGGAWASGAFTSGEAASPVHKAASAARAAAGDKAATSADSADEKAADAASALSEDEKKAEEGRPAGAGAGEAGEGSTPEPAKSQKPSRGAAVPGKKWGIVKEAWDEKVMVTAEYDRVQIVKKPWYEEKLVREAWTETINHPAEYAIDKIKVGVMHECDTCGFESPDDDLFCDHLASNGHIGWTRPVYEDRQVLVKEAWTETIDHPAVYQTVLHPAVTKTVHEDAVYKTVHHDAVYGWI